MLLAEEPVGMLKDHKSPPKNKSKGVILLTVLNQRKMMVGTRGNRRYLRVCGHRGLGDRDVTSRAPGLRSIKQTRFDS